MSGCSDVLRIHLAPRQDVVSEVSAKPLLQLPAFLHQTERIDVLGESKYGPSTEAEGITVHNSVKETQLPLNF